MEQEANTQMNQISLNSSQNLDESHDSASINQHFSKVFFFICFLIKFFKFSKKISKKKIYIKLDKDQLKMLKDSFIMVRILLFSIISKIFLIYFLKRPNIIQKKLKSSD